jgi:hypothetical protein
MPDWTSPLEVARDADIFIKLMHALFGIYVYVLFLPFFLQSLKCFLGGSGSSLSTSIGSSSLCKRRSNGQW